MNIFYLGYWASPRPDALFINWASGGDGKWRNEARKSVFLEQLEEFNILVFGVGSSPALIDALNSVPGWKSKLKNKHVLANSAGISALTTLSYNLDIYRLVQGTGVIPVKSIVHYLPEMRHFAKLLTLQPPDNLPLLLFDNHTQVTITLPNIGE